MAQSLYFNETCVPVDLTHCSQYYVDPCDCTQFYQCAQNLLRMFHRPCRPGTIYNHKTWFCDYPNDTICQTLRPWERCNVTDSRMEQLRSICFKSTPNRNSDQNTNGISVPLITQTILPAVFGVLVPVIIIGLVIYRYRNKRREREGESTLPQMANQQYFAETDEDYQQIDNSVHNPTYNAGSTLRPSLPARPEDRTANGTLQTANTHGNDFVYDNHAFRDETDISQSLECATGITGNPRPYMTLDNVINIAQGYDQISAVGSPMYSSENTMIGQAFVNSLNKAGEEGLTQSIKESVSSLETDGENDVTAERTIGNE